MVERHRKRWAPRRHSRFAVGVAVAVVVAVAAAGASTLCSCRGIPDRAEAAVWTEGADQAVGNAAKAVRRPSYHAPRVHPDPARYRPGWLASPADARQTCRDGAHRCWVVHSGLCYRAARPSGWDLLRVTADAGQATAYQRPDTRLCLPDAEPPDPGSGSRSKETVPHTNWHGCEVHPGRDAGIHLRLAPRVRWTSGVVPRAVAQQTRPWAGWARPSVTAPVRAGKTQRPPPLSYESHVTQHSH